jgi:MoaA/NifB/PqqE/SkfB family radical SAM enzyme
MTTMAVDLPLRFLWLELTQKCNLVCGHCYNDSSPQMPLVTRMREEDWVNAISQGARQGVTDIQFIGGEPLLVKYIDRLIAFAHSKSLNVEVFTNATGVTKRHVDLFKKYNVSVATSFYSFDPEIHDRITNKPGSWRRTVTAIRMMVSNQIPLRAGIILMPGNSDGFERTRDFLFSMGVTNCGSDSVRAFGRASDVQPMGDKYFDELCGRCGSDRVCVTSSGDIFPCVMSRATVVANFFETGLSLRRDELSTFSSKLRAAKNRSTALSACTPDCWPHGGCAPHDVCNPNKLTDIAAAACTPDCWPHGGCAPHDVCNPNKLTDIASTACTPDCWPHGGCSPHDVCNPHKKLSELPAASVRPL